jgi:RNA polymerase sigma-70 factor, ECF subfamily
MSDSVALFAPPAQNSSRNNLTFVRIEPFRHLSETVEMIPAQNRDACISSVEHFRDERLQYKPSSPPTPIVGARRCAGLGRSKGVWSMTGIRPESRAKGLAERLIVAIAQRRDQAAFAELFEGFAPSIKAYLRRSGCPEGQAEDLAQETLLAIWRKADRFDPARGSAAAWMFAIARHLRVDRLRRKPIPDPFFMDGPEELQPTPDDILVGAEAAARLRLALKSLAPDQVDIIHAAYVDQQPQSEIAARFDLPLGTVKSRLRRALQSLRVQLETDQ